MGARGSPANHPALLGTADTGANEEAAHERPRLSWPWELFTQGAFCGACSVICSSQ